MLHFRIALKMGKMVIRIHGTRETPAFVEISLALRGSGASSVVFGAPSAPISQSTAVGGGKSKKGRIKKLGAPGAHIWGGGVRKKFPKFCASSVPLLGVPMAPLLGVPMAPLLGGAYGAPFRGCLWRPFWGVPMAPFLGGAYGVSFRGCLWRPKWF